MEFLPEEMKTKIKEFTIFKPKSKEELQEAVDLWCEDREKAINHFKKNVIHNKNMYINLGYYPEKHGN